MRWVAILLALLATSSFAQSFPQPGNGDPRIQTVQYDPARVIRLTLSPGTQTMVELATGEVIQTIAVGDSAAWQVSAGKRGDFFFVKNVSANAITNMSVVTSSRVYNFELAPASGYGSLSPYHVKLIYPAPVPIAEGVAADAQFEYALSGSKLLRPSDVYQEGSFTILEWADDAPLPGIFVQEGDGEALVNGEMRNGRFVIAGTPSKLVFRLDGKAAYATRRPLRDADDN